MEDFWQAEIARKEEQSKIHANLYCDSCGSLLSDHDEIKPIGTVYICRNCLETDVMDDEDWLLSE